MKVILLEDIMKEFAINRNRLNELFIKENLSLFYEINKGTKL